MTLSDPKNTCALPLVCVIFLVRMSDKTYPLLQQFDMTRAYE